MKIINKLLVLIFFISISLISVNGVFENGMDYTVELPTTIYVNEPFNFTLNTLTQSGFNLDYSIVDFGTNELKHYNLNNINHVYHNSGIHNITFILKNSLGQYKIKQETINVIDRPNDSNEIIYSELISRYINSGMNFLWNALILNSNDDFTYEKFGLNKDDWNVYPFYQGGDKKLTIILNDGDLINYQNKNLYLHVLFQKNDSNNIPNGKIYTIVTNKTHSDFLSLNNNITINLNEEDLSSFNLYEQFLDLTNSNFIVNYKWKFNGLEVNDIIFNPQLNYGENSFQLELTNVLNEVITIDGKINVNPKNPLEFEFVKLHRNDKKERFDNSGRAYDDDFKVGDQISAEVKICNVKNTDLENIRLYGEMFRIDIDEEELDIVKNDCETIDIDFDESIIPFDNKEERSNFNLYASVLDNESYFHEANFTIRVKIKKDREELIIDNLFYTKEIDLCSFNGIKINGDLVNVGSRDIEDLTLQLTDDDIELNKEFSLDEGDDQSFSFNYNINNKLGERDIILQAFNKNNNKLLKKSISINVIKCLNDNSNIVDNSKDVNNMNNELKNKIDKINLEMESKRNEMEKKLLNLNLELNNININSNEDSLNSNIIVNEIQNSTNSKMVNIIWYIFIFFSIFILGSGIFIFNKYNN